jgi:hypothetical protein
MTKTFVIGVFIVAVLSGFCGCTQTNSPASTNGLDTADSKSQLKELKFDLGILEEDQVIDCLIGEEKTKIVKKIIRSCGCVGPNFEVGEKINLSEPIKLNVDLANKPAGPGTQDVLIYFEDESAVRIMVNYVYLPLPNYTPESLIFKKDETEKSVVLVFPEESNVTIKNITLPSFFTSVPTKELKKNTLSINIKITLDRNKREDERSGVIRIISSSKRKSDFTIPYLVLFH